MAINYTTLTGSKSTAGSIANWVNRSDLPTDNILLEGEAWIYERLRAREMKTQVAFQFDASTSEEALPSDFLDPIQYLPYEWDDPLLYVNEEYYRPPRDSSGALFSGSPTMWTILGETAYVDVTCDSNFGGMLLYYKRPEALSGSNETNFLTVKYPTLMRHVLMMKAYEHMKDSSREGAYEARALRHLADAKVTDDLSRRTQHVPAH